MLSVVHHPAYRAEIPEGHRFPMGKYSALARVLLREGIVREGGFIEPDVASFDLVTAAHAPDYVQAVFDANLSREAERRIGLPMTPSVSLRARAATAGTLLAARLALANGIACNTAGGSHHAARDYGAGFCTFNDVAVAAAVLLAEGAVDRILVVDCDVHQGDGTAFIFENDPRVFTFSMHGEKNYPVRRAASDLDIDLPDRMEDEDYLAVLEDTLPGLLSRTRPDLVFYNAGVDPHRDDRLGRLALTDEGLARRDAYVIETCLRQGRPVTGVIGGGYDHDVERLARRHAHLHRAAAAAIRRPGR